MTSFLEDVAALTAMAACDLPSDRRASVIEYGLECARCEFRRIGAPAWEIPSLDAELRSLIADNVAKIIAAGGNVCGRA